jgi:hypothetical protein
MNKLPQNTDQPVTMARNAASPVADRKSTNDIPATFAQSATMPTSPSQPNAANIEVLVQGLSQLFEDVTDSVSLKFEKRAAEREFKSWNTEFDKSKKFHEKFPAMEEAQRRSKDLAKKALTSIEEKCAEKDANANARMRQLAQHLLPSGEDNHCMQKLQTKVHSLEDTTQSLKKQLHEHQSLIEKQRTERLAELQARDTEIRKLQDQLATTFGLHSLEDTIQSLKKLIEKQRTERLAELQARDTDIRKLQNQLATLHEHQSLIEKQLHEHQSLIEKQRTERLAELQAQDTEIRKLQNQLPTTAELVRDFKPIIEESNRNALKSRTDVERFESILDSLSAKLPENFQASFQTICSKVEKLCKDYEQKQNKATKEPLGDTDKAVLSDCEKRLVRVERLIKDVPHTINFLLTSVIKDQEKLGENIETLQRRVGCMDTTAILAEHQSRLNDPFQRVKSFQPEMDDSEKRLELVEKQSVHNRSEDLTVSEPRQNGNLSAPVESCSVFEQLASLERRLADIENLSKQPTDAHAPPIDMNEVVALVDSMQSASNTTMARDIDELYSRLGKVEKDVDKFPNAYVSMAAFTPLTAQLHSISNSVDLLTQSERSHAAQYKQWAEDQKDLLAKENERVDAVSHGIINVEKRLNLINTKELALHIMNRMDSAYPNLRAAETTLEHHKAAIRLAESRFKGIDKEVKDLRDQNTNTKELAKEAKDAVGVVATQTKAAQDAVNGLLEQRPKDSEAIAHSFADIRNQLSNLSELIKDKEAKESAAKVAGSKAATPIFDRASNGSARGRTFTPVPVADRAPNGSGRGRSFTSPASRQSSVEPLPKKRRHNDAPLAPTLAKWKRKRPIGEPRDDIEDPRFEPDPPRISDSDGDYE